MSHRGQNRKSRPVLLQVRSTPKSGHRWIEMSGRLWADIVAKVFLRCRTKILRAADAFCARRCEGPCRLIQNRSRTSVVALKSDAAAERSKDQLSRDFWGCSIFDFCNNIGQELMCGCADLITFHQARVAGDIRHERRSRAPSIAGVGDLDQRRCLDGCGGHRCAFTTMLARIPDGHIFSFLLTPAAPWQGRIVVFPCIPRS
jgi:hypothetical protein